MSIPHDDPSANTAANSCAPVVVVGGGLAGIAAALRLAHNGRPVQLLESKRKLGGRAGSYSSRRPDGSREEVDYCQHVGMGCCTALGQLIEMLGQQNQWTRHREYHFYGADGRYRRLAGLRWAPAPLHLLPWLIKWPGLSLTDRVRIARTLQRLNSVAVDEESDAQSALDWLVTEGQSPQAREHFWSTLIASALGEQLDRVSLAMVAKVLQDGFLRDREGYHLLIPQQPLSSLFNDQTLGVLNDVGVDTKLSCAVSSIRAEDEHFVVTAAQDTIRASAVVLAVPWHQLHHLTRNAESDDLHQVACRAATLDGAPITGVHTWWDRAWMPHPHAALVGTLCQWIFPKPVEAGLPAMAEDSAMAENTALADDAADTGQCYYQIVISGSRDLPSDFRANLADHLRRDLAPLFPEITDSKLMASKVVTDPQAVFSVAPNSWSKRPAAGTLAANIAVAGDWTNTGWPATMESAVRSGFAAADELLSSARSTSGTELRSKR